jgi:hypothetical protein
MCCGVFCICVRVLNANIYTLIYIHDIENADAHLEVCLQVGGPQEGVLFVALLQAEARLLDCRLGCFVWLVCCEEGAGLLVLSFGWYAMTCGNVCVCACVTSVKGGTGKTETGWLIDGCTHTRI